MIAIAPHITAFLKNYLADQRGASEHTCDTYAYSFQLLFEFASDKIQVAPSQLCLEQIDASLVCEFLEHLEGVRKNASSTRNVRLAAIKSFFRFLEYRLPQAAHAEFLSGAHAFLALVTALGNFFHPRGVLLFNFTIKFHYLVHIAQYSRHFNPRRAWCYSREDFMQRIKRIVGSCQRGTPPPRVCSKAVRKYADGLAFSMIEDACWQ